MEVVTLITIVIALTVCYAAYKKYFREVTIFEYQRGLLYKKGKLVEILEPGQYNLLGSSSQITPVDTRLKTVTVSGQELLSADNISIKISIIVKYKVVDPETAINKIEYYQDALYSEIQLALREFISSKEIDTILEKRSEIEKYIFEGTKEKVKEYGTELDSVAVKDFMFPGDLKKIFAQVVNARKEGLAALEKARGESAALRNLVNAAKLLESNPALSQLRILQSLGESKGNTVVLNLDSNNKTLPVNKNPKE